MAPMRRMQEVGMTAEGSSADSVCDVQSSEADQEKLALA